MSRAVRYLVSTFAMALAARSLAAQSPTPDSIFGARRWAIEAPLGGYFASLLRFGSGTSAWKLGVHWNAGVESRTSVSPTGSPDDASFGEAYLSIGRRRYGGRGPVRPFLGLGLTASAGGRSSDNSDERRWSAGAYGEMGAAYFLNRHLSLGGLGSLRVSRSEHSYEQSSSLPMPRMVSRSWSTAGPSLLAMVSVYF